MDDDTSRYLIGRRKIVLHRDTMNLWEDEKTRPSPPPPPLRQSDFIQRMEFIKRIDLNILFMGTARELV